MKSKKQKQTQAHNKYPKPKNDDQNWTAPCSNFSSLPTVEPTDLCGPRCFVEADTAGGNW